MTTPSFTGLKTEYQKLWDTMTVNPSRVPMVNKIALRLQANKARYQAVEAKTGVPWFIVAAWHERESSADFRTQLAQGDPLGKRSTHVPAGRGPFKTWEDGAFDALVTLKGLDRVTDWGPARCAYETERYNGFGYRNFHPSVLSPYLWSFSNHYTRGKYVADGKFSSTAVDAQCGAIPIIKQLMAIDADARFKSQPVVITFPKVPVPAPEHTVPGSIVVGGATAAATQTDPKIMFLIMVIAVAVGIGAFLLIRKWRKE